MKYQATIRDRRGRYVSHAINSDLHVLAKKTRDHVKTLSDKEAPYTFEIIDRDDYRDDDDGMEFAPLFV